MLITTPQLVYFVGGTALGVGIARAAHFLHHAVQRRRLGVRGPASKPGGPPSVLTPSDIIAQIKQAPVMQQPRAGQTYHGMNVRWRVSFESAFVSGLTTLRVMCQDQGNYPWVICDVRRWAYPQLSGLLPHAPLWIMGTISHIASDEIFLRHVRLSFEE